MVNFKIEVNGIDELKRAFSQLPDDVQKRASLPALKAAANVAKKYVVAYAPVGTHKGRKFTKSKGKGKTYVSISGVRMPGTLKRSIWVKRIKRNLTPSQVGYIVSVDPIAFYYKFLVRGFVAKGTPVPPNPFFEMADMASKAAREAEFDKVFGDAAVKVLAKLEQKLR